MIFYKKETEKMQLVTRPGAYCEGLAWLFAWLYAKEQTGNIGGPRTHNPIIYGKSTKTLLKVSYMPSSWKARLHLERCHIKNFLLRHLFFSDFKVLEIGKTAAGAPPPFLYLGFQATPESFSSIGSASVGNFFFLWRRCFLQFLSTSLCL